MSDPRSRADEDAVAAWSRAHGEDVSGSRLASAWITGIYALARQPVIRRLSPDALSAGGVLTAAAAVAVAGTGRWGALPAAVLVLMTGILDGLDGAVALQSGRARPLGAVIDGIADRIGDIMFALVLVILGAPAWMATAIAAVTLLHEYLRARAQAAGMAGPGAITAAERPTRVIITLVACVGAAAAPGGTPATGWPWATVSGWLWLAVAVVGLGHLAAAVRGRLG